jgi:hypothetical protein
MVFKASLGKVRRLFQKQNKNKRVGGIPQVVQHLPSIRKTLGSSLVKPKKKERERERERKERGRTKEIFKG